MTNAFAAWRILGGPVAGLALVLAAGSAATEGWRDKRRGTAARHVVVVDRELPCRLGHRSAVPHGKPLSSQAFRRATTLFDGSRS
jgi:hypothetical protein